MKSSLSCLRPRKSLSAGGFTLIELMVASAVALVGLLAAAAVVSSFGQFQRKSNRVLKRGLAAGISMSVINKAAENNGYYWPSPGLSMIPRDNLLSVYTYSAGGEPAIDPQNNFSAKGFVQGTDILETWTGRALKGTVATVSGSGTTRTITFDSRDPFIPGVDASNGPLLLFIDPANPPNACLGLTTSVTGLLNPGQAVTAVVSGQEPIELGPAVSFPTSPYACPASGMNAYALHHRTRFLVHQEQVDLKYVRGLYIQESDKRGMYVTAPRMLVGGVANMQVVWLGENPNALFSDYGISDCLAVGGISPPLCKVFRKAGENCTACASNPLLRSRYVGVELRMSVFGPDTGGGPTGGPDGGFNPKSQTNQQGEVLSNRNCDNFASHEDGLANEVSIIPNLPQFNLVRSCSAVHFRNVTMVDP